MRQKKKGKRKESINQRLKQREIEKNKKGFFDPTISEQCAKLPKEKKYKREAMITWLKPGGVKRSPTLVTNEIFVPSCVPCRTKEKRRQKEERPKQTKPNLLPKSNLIKSYWSMMIARIIFDLMGNDLQSQTTTCLWFGIKMKHLHVWDFIHLERFSSICLDPLFLLMLF